MQVFTDIIALVGFVRAKNWWSAIKLLGKIISEIGDTVQPTKEQHTSASLAAIHTDLASAIESECHACKAAGRPSGALLALLLKLAPLLLSLLGV